MEGVGVVWKKGGRMGVARGQGTKEGWGRTGAVNTGSVGWQQCSTREGKWGRVSKGTARAGLLKGQEGYGVWGEGIGRVEKEDRWHKRKAKIKR